MSALSIKFSLEEVRITRNRNTKPTDRNVYMRLQGVVDTPTGGGAMMPGMGGDTITVNVTEAEANSYFIGDVYEVALNYLETAQGAENAEPAAVAASEESA